MLSLRRLTAFVTALCIALQLASVVAIPTPALEADKRAVNLTARAAPGAPHFVVYADKFVSGVNAAPDASVIRGFNTYVLSFWLLAGAWDKAYEWTTLTPAERAAVKAQYNAAGIKIMVAAFGATDVPTSTGADPIAVANNIAAWVKQYDIDGVDVDYEDFNAFNAGSAENWLISFTRQLRNQLPSSSNYIITHAPVAPWFGGNWPGGGYLKIHREVGNLIDWYNVQFYNQGASEYTTCNGLLSQSSSQWPNTAVFQIVNAGVPASKLVIGKPATQGDANNGYVDPNTLAGCVQQAKNQGWNGGVSTWQYPNAQSSWIRTVRGSAWPF